MNHFLILNEYYHFDIFLNPLILIHFELIHFLAFEFEYVRIVKLEYNYVMLVMR